MVESINEVLNSLNHLSAGFCRYAMGVFLQSSLLIVVLFGLDLLLRKHVRAVVRYCLWLLVLVKLILPPTLSLPTGIGYWATNGVPGADHLRYTLGFDQETPEISPGQYAANTPSPTEPVTIGPVESDSSVTTMSTRLIPITWQAVVLLLWIVGMLAFVAILTQRIRFVRGLVKTGTTAEGALFASLEACQKMIHLRGRIDLRTSDVLPSPAVCGLLRPTILMPASLVARLTPEELKATLVHELAHIKRADLWINAIQTVLQVVYFYNPFVWLANAMIRRTCEEAVDETVLVTLDGQVQGYSNTLINISEMGFWKADFGLRLIGVAESKKALKRRIKHMLTQPVPQSSKIGILGTTAILLIAAILLPMARAERSNQKATANSQETINKVNETGPVMTEGDVLVDPNTGLKFTLTKTISGTNNVIQHVNKLTLSPDGRFLLWWGRVVPLNGSEAFRFNERRRDNAEVAVAPNMHYIAYGIKVVWLQPVSPETLQPNGPAKQLLDLKGGYFETGWKPIRWTRDSQVVFFKVIDKEGLTHQYAFSAATGASVNYPDTTSTGIPSPDGKGIALTDTWGFRVKSVDSDDTRILLERRLPPECWSRDGKWLIGVEPWEGAKFVRYPEGHTYMVRRPKELAANYTLCVGPSADRDRLLFYEGGYKLKYWTKVVSAKNGDVTHVENNNLGRGFQWTPDGQAMFHIERRNNTLHLSSRSGGKSVPFALSPSIPTDSTLMSVSPDSKWLLYKHESDNDTLDVYVIPLSTVDRKVNGLSTKVFKVTSYSKGHRFAPVWSPDSTRVALTSKHCADDDKGIWIAFTDGRKSIRLTQATMTERNLKWTPDGNMVAFISDDGHVRELKVVPAFGGKVNVIRRWVDEDGPGWGWSPDSKSLTIAEGGRLVRQPLSGGKAELIVNLREYGIGEDTGVTWSPDGKRVALATVSRVRKNPMTVSQIIFARIDANQLKETATVDVGSWTGHFAWSPDCTHVAYMCEDAIPVRSAGRLYEVAVDDIIEKIESGAIQPIQPKTADTK
ncbi:M56 family metallopeptidase [Planctomycetota bacterium]